MKNPIYPRTVDAQTVYLTDVVSAPNIEVGDYTMCSDGARPIPQFFRS